MGSKGCVAYKFMYAEKPAISRQVMLRDLAAAVIDSRAENVGSPARAGFAVDGAGICCK